MQTSNSSRVVSRNASRLALALAFALGSCAESPTSPTSAAGALDPVSEIANAVGPAVRISEFHYDNAGTDVGEAIEISAPAGTDLTGWQLVLYNGSATSLAPYGTRTLSGPLTTTCDARGVLVEAYPSNGIQNGNPDGIALIDASGAVAEFLSYGGSFTAASGPAAGMTSTDIGLTEPATTMIGISLQRDPSGAWMRTVDSFGACNDGTTNEEPEDPQDPEDPPVVIPAIRFSEIHYDNNGVDAGEAIELEGPAGDGIGGWTIALYSGTDGLVYATTPLVGTFADQCDGRGTIVVRYPENGLQNGPRDGMALVDAEGQVVEFLSYEGSFEALDGPALGMTATDLGVFEGSTTPAGRSLQRRPDGVAWEPPAANSFGNCHGLPPIDPPVPTNTISFSGRTPSDPALPVGFEDQLFATLRAGDGTTVPTTFTWASETPALASIDANGVLRALGEGTATLRATAADGTTATYALPLRVATAGTTANYANNAEFGEPADADASDDFIVRRAQYTASYSHLRNTPNWVSYDLDATHIGAEDRCDCFTFDPELPATFTRYTTADYTGAGAAAGYGIDRGHLARSFDRTTGSLDNATTFLFSNIIPQAADNNQGPWAALENHLGDLARFQDREVHIIAGVAGNKGTVKDEGRIVIPATTWKVAVVLPRDHGIAQLSTWAAASQAQVIAVVMPNDPGIRNVPWQTYAVTVDAVEALSGYDLLALLRDDIEVALESGTVPPVAEVDGPYAGFTLDPIAMSAAASTDADGQPLTFTWDLGDGTAATGVTVTHAYAAPGTYPVRVIATDALGLADTVQTTATITPLPPAVGIDRLYRLLDDIVTSGILRANPTSLTAKLDAARAQLARGNASPARGQLGALRNEVNALVRSGRLSAAQAAPILELIERVLASLERGG